MANKANPHYEGKTLSYKSKIWEEQKMVIYPRHLNIVWGGDNRYWKVHEGDKPAELYQVSWLEVTGSVGDIEPNKDYEVGFKLQFTPDAFGWGSSPIFIMVKRGKKGKFAWHKCILDSNSTLEFDFKTMLKKSGEISDAADFKKLYFGLYEVWSGKWKGGLKIHYAFVKECTST